MSEPRYLHYDASQDVLIVRIIGEVLLDPLSVREMGDELMGAIARHDQKRLIVSFAEVGRCSTDVINVLLLAKKRLLAEGGELKLCEMSPNIRHTYQMLNLDGTVFRIYETVDDALTAFALDSTM